MVIVNPSEDDHSTHSDFKTKTAKARYNETKCFMRYRGNGYFKVCFSQADIDKAKELKKQKQEDRDKILDDVNNQIKQKGYKGLSVLHKRMYHSFKSEEARTKKDLVDKTYIEGGDPEKENKIKERKTKKKDKSDERDKEIAENNKKVKKEMEIELKRIAMLFKKLSRH